MDSRNQSVHETTSGSNSQLGDAASPAATEAPRRRRRVSARLRVSALIGSVAIMLVAIGVWNSVFRGASGLEACAVAATSCDSGAPVFDVTFSRDSIPTGGIIAGPLTADSSRVTQVYVRQSGDLVPATLKILDDDLGVRTTWFSPDDPNDPNILGLVHSGSRTGRITLRVEDPNDPNNYEDMEISVGAGCGSCGGDGCTAGAVHISADGVDVGFKLGQADDDDTAGQLRIRSDDPCADLSTPAGLLFHLEHYDVEVIRDGSDDLRQILSPQALADIITIDATEYEIRFYAADDAGSPDPNGYYGPDPNDVLVTWVVESTDGAPDYEELQISKVVDSTTQLVYTYTYSEPQGVDWQWELTTGEDTESDDRTETVTWTDDDPNDADSDWTRTYQVTQDGGTYQKTIEIHSVFNWGMAVTERAVMLDPSGDPSDPNDALATYFGYYDSGATTKGRLKWVDNPDGSWSYYAYENDGRLESVMSAWEDYGVDLSSATPAAGSSRKIEYDYQTDPNEVDADGPICITEKIEGTAVELTEYDYSEDPNTADLIVDVKRCGTSTAGVGSRTYLTTTTTYDGDDIRRPLEIEYPDGRLATYVYDDDGTYTDSGTPENASFDPETAGTDDRVTITMGTTTYPDGVADKTTREVVVTDVLGNKMLQETYVCETAGSNYERIGWTVSRRDDLGRATDVYRSDNTHVENTWSDCCGLTSVVDQMNIETTYVRDSLNRVTSRTKEGVAVRTDPSCPAQDDIETAYAFSVASNLRTVTATVSDESSNELASETVRDLAGRVISQEDPAGLDTDHAYDTTGQGGREVTVTRPGGGTEITEYYRDGRIKKVSGTAVVSRYYAYDKENDGDQWTKVYIGSTDTSSDRWAQTTYDALGRTKLKQRPAFVTTSTDTVTTTYSYNSDGQLESTAIADSSSDLMADTRYEYDSDTGQLIRTGLDLNNDGDLDLGGTDRINETETRYNEVSSDEWWLETKTYVYLTDSSSTRTQTGQEGQRLSGFGTDEIAETQSLDVFDNITTVSTVLDPSDPTVIETTEYEATDNEAVQVTRNGLIQSVKDKGQITTTYAYDGLGRQTGITDGLGNETETHYNALGQVDYVEDGADNRTTYEYDDPNDGGRVKAIENANDGYTHYDYNAHGQVTHVWGDVPNPVDYEYDSTFGQLTEVHTYRTGASWSQPAWPDEQGRGTEDTTEFTYDDATGLLTEKEDPADKAVSYTYTPDGKLEVRSWARAIGGGDPNLTTTYDYYDGSTGSGDLEQIDYGDSTPDVDFSYTRAGKLYTVSDAVGERTFAYEANDKWRTEEFDPNSLLPDLQVKQTYDNVVSYAVGPMQVFAHFQRLSKIEVGTSADPDADYKVEYDYDRDSDRMTKVTGTGLPDNGANYTYLADSHLLWKTRYKSGGTYTARVIRTYEDDRDLLKSVQNKWTNSTTVSLHQYANDDLGRRTSVIRNGTAFLDPNDPNTALAQMDLWDYDDRNELTDSDRYVNTDPNSLDPNSPDPNDAQAAQDRAYTYDPIGNRDEYREGTDPNTAYTTNSRNQYTATTNPSESFRYDDDGNLTDDGTWDYTWDAENRLITVEPDATPKSGDKKVEFVYDYRGRRVEKTVSTHNGTSWSVTDRRRFVWSDWLLVLELDATDPNDVTILRKYTWGLDSAGQSGPGNSVDSAGGIGGLLATEDVEASKDYYYVYDANGNVGQVLDASDGSVDAHYEYDAYGNTVISSGDFAADNPFRFSTKYCDDELDYAGTDNDGLCYFGYRYYSPRLGRWINRDPLLEKGHRRMRGHADYELPGNTMQGPDLAIQGHIDTTTLLEPGEDVHDATLSNVYGFVGNRPTNSIDSLGLFPRALCCPYITWRCRYVTGLTWACRACGAACYFLDIKCHACDVVPGFELCDQPVCTDNWWPHCSGCND